VVQGFWDRVAQREIDDNPYRLGFLQLVCVSETDASAEAEYADHVKYFYRKMLRIHPPYAEAPGYRSIASIRESIRPQIGEEAQKAAQELEWKDFVEQGHIIAGSPATVREQLTEAIKMLRVGHLMCLLHIGSMPKDLTLKNTEMFAREVMPAIEGLWDGYEDHWWPQKLMAPTPAPVAD
jgi:alkanesulfonate monooxygenase SsuD/methylene tetrahydromethanopterin reductase-like flavin-dependent oxidoreductase (luciferase family)